MEGVAKLMMLRGFIFKRVGALAPLLFFLFLLVNSALAQSDTLYITAHWVAPGDDKTIGTASLYDFRYAFYQFDTTEWEQIYQVTDEPIPNVAGTLETYILKLPYTQVLNDTIWIACRAADEALNWSNITNVYPVDLTKFIFPPIGLAFVPDL